MELASDLISQFVKATKDDTKTPSESTVYGTVDEVITYGGRTWAKVKLDGSGDANSGLLTPVSTTVDVKEDERVMVSIKNHTATIVGNMSMPAGRSEDVNNASSTASRAQESVSSIQKELEEFEKKLAEKISTEELEADLARIDVLEADNATIKLTLNANQANINSLLADNVTINKTLTANTADIENLKTTKLDASVADIKYATIEELNSAKADIVDLDADVANIDTLIFGSASGSTIQTSFANAIIAQLGDAQIKSAMIKDISASKIQSGDIITNNVRVLSEDGSLLISDETIQISDDNRVRVQIGKDSSNDYSINVWDIDGNLMFSEGGITDNAIKEAIIRNDMVSDDANIAAHKLDIDSLFEEINGSSKTIKSTKVYLDDKKQTLDVAFESLTTDVTELQNGISSQGTKISTIQGQISSKVWQQDINTAVSDVGEKTDTLSTKYTTLEQEVDSLSTTVESHTSTLATKADSHTVSTVSDKVTSLETNLSGFRSSVSETYATKTEMSNIEVGGRNLLPNTKIFKGSNISSNAIIPEETYKGFAIRSKDNTEATEGFTDMLTFLNIYPEKLGEEYTLSFYARGTGRLLTYFYGATGYVRIAKCVQSNGTVKSTADGSTEWQLTDDWNRYWVTWTLANEGDISVVKWILFRLYYGGKADICGVKLEKGNRATDWTPAPEDVESDISIAYTAAEAAQASANQNAVDMANIVTAFNEDIANLQTQIDGSITTWFYEGAPSDANEPTKNWTTIDLKNVHLSDLYYDTVTGYCYRYQVKNDVYSWQRVTDTDITKALADAQKAQDTADQKRRVFYNQPTVPYDVGDLWVQGSVGDILRCQTAKVNGQSYSSSDWIPASKYTDDTKANAAQSTANAAQSAANTAQSSIDNLRIGGRNLLRNSKGNSNADWAYDAPVVTDDVKGYCIERINVTLSGENYIASTRTDVVEQSTEYTFSADVWCNEYLKTFDLFWLSDTEDEQKTAAGYVNIRSNPNRGVTPDKWTRISWTFTTHDNDRTGYIRFDNNGTKEEGTAAILRVANLKLEKGNRATDWTPAPEDLESRVSKTETQILQNGESISLLANRTTNVENKFAGYSTTEQMNSAIEQKANSITSTVSETYTSKADFENLEVGGRNLIAGTSKTQEYVGNASGSANGYKDVWGGKTIGIPTNTSYVISFDAKADVAQTIRCHFYSPNTTTSSLSSTGQTGKGADGSIDVSITTEWKRYWVKWTQTPATTAKNIIVGRNFSENDIYIRAVKFEAGNTPTDWTLAPEDMATADALETVESSAGLVESRVTINESLIQQLSDCIATLVTDGNGESLMTQTANGWTFSTGDIQNIVESTSENLESLTNEMGDVNSAVDVLKQAVTDLGILNDYVKIGTYENEPCIELGESDSDFKLVITNTRIMFMEGTGVPAYLNNQSLFIKKAVIEEELQQGEFVWKIRSNGNLGLVWKGAD